MATPTKRARKPASRRSQMRSNSKAHNDETSHGDTFPAAMTNPAPERIFRSRRGLPQTGVTGRDGKLAAGEMGEIFEQDIRDIATLH